MNGATTIGNVSPGSVRVELIFRAALSSPQEREIVLWPEGWRLPQVGESVQFGPSMGGFVQYVDWSLTDGLVRVFLR